MAFNGDVTVPTGEQADVVLVTGGTATIAGDVKTVVVFDGTAILQGATVESVFVTGGSLSIDAATTVTRRRPDARRDRRRSIRPPRSAGPCRASMTDLVAAGRDPRPDAGCSCSGSPS